MSDNLGRPSFCYVSNIVQPNAAIDPMIGNVLADRYRVVRLVGQGGMGVVYEAEHVQLGKRVAIKLLLAKFADDREAIARFQREALTVSQIGNPHIIDVVDIGVAPDGRSFVCRESQRYTRGDDPDVQSRDQYYRPLDYRGNH